MPEVIKVSSSNLSLLNKDLHGDLCFLSIYWWMEKTTIKTKMSLKIWAVKAKHWQQEAVLLGS